MLVSLAQSSEDAWAPAPCPDVRASDHGPVARPAAPQPGALLPSVGPSAVCKHFLPLTQPPPGASQLERVGLADGSGLAVAPTQLPRPRGLGRAAGGGYRLAREQPSGKPRRQELREVAREAQVSRKKEEN